MPALTQRTLLGAVLMLVGTVLFGPAALPGVTGVISYGLVPGILLLTVGTYLVGTDVGGKPV
jgi:hypothetical protein